MFFCHVCVFIIKIIAQLASFHMRKYKLNENFFEKIDSEEKAYFLGLLYADGYINETLNMVDLTLHKQDKEILDKLIVYLYPQGRPLKIIRNDYIRLVINSKKIVEDLKLHGCFQKKTFKLEFPIILNELIKHFIRGYFDGDGCITIDNKKTLNISIVGTINFLNVIKQILCKECKLNNTVYDNRHPNRNNNIRALRYGGNIIMNRIYHYLYDNSIIYLTRKKNKFLDILENKSYFCNTEKIRTLNKHYIEYNGMIYNQMQLSRILSNEIKISIRTIKSRLQKGWSINEIISTPLNKRKII